MVTDKNFLNWVFFNGKFTKFEQAKISIATNALQYGTGVFGGIRGYYNKNKKIISIFKLKDHFRRFLSSLKILGVTINFSQNELEDITIELAKKNKPTTDVYFRPFAYASSLNISPDLSINKNFDFALYMIPLGDYLPTNKGLKVKVSSFFRVTDNSIPPRAKISGAYINSSLAKKEAVDLGFDEAIFLTKEGYVCEGSAENLFIVREGKLITPPESDDILEGITRKVIITLAKDLGIKVEVRRINRTELYIAEEVFFCGTGVQIAWIKEVDGRVIGNGKRGKITQKIQEKYFQIVRGEDPKYFHWCSFVRVR